MHENGFLKIVLDRNNRGALRIHIWNGEHVDHGNVHDHCWDFTSTILCGELHYESFVKSDLGGINFGYYRHNRTLELTNNGQTQMAKLEAAGARTSGETYMMTHSELHRSWGVQGNTTITIVQTGPKLKHYANVLTELSSAPPDYSVKPISTNRVRSALEAFIDVAESYTDPNPRVAERSSRRTFS